MRPCPIRFGTNTIVAPLFIGARPTLAVMDILTQRDHVDDEMKQRGRARIAGSAIAARFGRFAGCPASAGVPCHNGLGYPPAGFAAIDIGEVDDRRTICTKHAPLSWFAPTPAIGAVAAVHRSGSSEPRADLCQPVGGLPVKTAN
jgi:hypothetical protein